MSQSCIIKETSFGQYCEMGEKKEGLEVPGNKPENIAKT